MTEQFFRVSGERIEIREPRAQLTSTTGDENLRPRFRLVPFNQIILGSVRVYLVKGIIPRAGLVVVWGPPKCGKCFWTFDMVMHVALGWEYRGRRVQQGPVIYLALEGGKGFEARIEAFRQRFLAEDPDPVPFYLIADAVNLVKEHPDLIGSIRQQAKDPPAVVVIDTLNRSLAGSESDDKDMAAYIRAADAIRNAFGCVVIVVHQCGVDATRPRGHTSLAGAVDAQLAAGARQLPVRAGAISPLRRRRQRQRRNGKPASVSTADPPRGAPDGFLTARQGTPCFAISSHNQSVREGF